MKLEELHTYYGTWTAFGRALEVGMNNYQYWRKIGYIPYSTQLVIEKKTNGLFVANIDHAKPSNKV